MAQHRVTGCRSGSATLNSEIIGFEMDDPRLADVSVTSAEASPDMRHAHVKIAIEGGQEKKTLAVHDSAKNFLRHEPPAPRPPQQSAGVTGASYRAPVTFR